MESSTSQQQQDHHPYEISRPNSYVSERGAQPPTNDRRTVTVIRNDCGEKMMCEAARKACIALDCSNENDPDRKQDLATSLKASFDYDYEGTWNAVVGSDFGASITHELSKILFFAIEPELTANEKPIYVLLYQQTDKDLESVFDSPSRAADSAGMYDQPEDQSSNLPIHDSVPPTLTTTSPPPPPPQSVMLKNIGPELAQEEKAFHQAPDLDTQDAPSALWQLPPSPPAPPPSQSDDPIEF